MLSKVQKCQVEMNGSLDDDKEGDTDPLMATGRNQGLEKWTRLGSLCSPLEDSSNIIEFPCSNVNLRLLRDNEIAHRDTEQCTTSPLPIRSKSCVDPK